MKAVNVTLRRSIVAAAVVLAVPVLSSCGTNFNAPTDQVYQPAVGTNDRSGSVDILNALIVSGADGSGTLVAGLVNNDVENDDALVGVEGSGPDTGLQVEIERGQVPVSRDGLTQLAEEAGVTVRGEAIKAGYIVELTFNFERGDSVTLEVPVQARTGPYAEISVPVVAPASPSPSAEAPAGH